MKLSDDPEYLVAAGEALLSQRVAANSPWTTCPARTLLALVPSWWPSTE